MEQTAVEQFIKQLEEKGSAWENASIGRIQISITVEDYLELQRQAKAMEKEQKIKFAFDFYYDFSNKLGVPFNLIIVNRLNAEQYYNETFKSE